MKHIQDFEGFLNEWQSFKTGKIYNGRDTLKPGTTFQMSGYTVEVVKDLGDSLLVKHHGANFKKKPIEMNKDLLKGAVILSISIM